MLVRCIAGRQEGFGFTHNPFWTSLYIIGTVYVLAPPRSQPCRHGWVGSWANLALLCLFAMCTKQ